MLLLAYAEWFPAALASVLDPPVTSLLLMALLGLAVLGVGLLIGGVLGGRLDRRLLDPPSRQSD